MPRSALASNDERRWLDDAEKTEHDEPDVIVRLGEDPYSNPGKESITKQTTSRLFEA